MRTAAGASLNQAALLDRLPHHAEAVTLEGRSFRMKDVIDK